MDNIIQVTDFLQGRTYYMINDLPLEVIMCQTIARSYYLSYEWKFSSYSLQFKSYAPPTFRRVVLSKQLESRLFRGNDSSEIEKLKIKYILLAFKVTYIIDYM